MIIFDAFEKQQKFIESFFNPVYKWLLYGGAIRGGKSFVGIAILIMLCKLYPNSRHIIVRRDLPTLKRNVLPVFNKVCPQSFLKSFNKTEYVATFTNGSKIIFMAESIQDDPDLNRFRGLEFNTALLEEMNEIKEVTFYKVIERCGAWIVPNTDKQPPNKIIGTCNPDQGWVKTNFYIPWSQGALEAPYFYLPATIEDNPNIPESYKESLKSLPPETYNQFVKGSWDAVDHIHQLVSWEVIHNCQKRIESVDETISLGADVGRHGPDPTVITLLKGPNIHDIKWYPKTDLVQVAKLIEQKILEYRISSDHVCVDSVGLGAGVVDILVNKGYYVIPMVGGSTSVKVAGESEYKLTELLESSHFTFKNWKAYSFWVTAEAMRDGKIGNFTDENLKADAGAVHYYTPDDKTIQVEKKEDFRKRVGRSSDYWDSYTYAVWSYLSETIIPVSLPYTSRQVDS